MLIEWTTHAKHKTSGISPGIGIAGSMALDQWYGRYMNFEAFENLVSSKSLAPKSHAAK